MVKLSMTNPFQIPRVLLPIVLLFTAGIALAASGGTIFPSRFVFRNVVPYQPPGAGGWKAACVDVTFVKPAIPQAWMCPVQVGVPEILDTGPVTDPRAQVASADALNAAAHTLLNQPGPVVVASFCNALRRMMEASIKSAIPGARVTTCIEARPWATRFP